MSNFFEQELRSLFGDGGIIDSPLFVGRTCLGALDSDLRVRAEFVAMRSKGCYDALQLTVLKRTDGVVDTLDLHFRDILVANHDLPYNTFPYFLTDGNYVGWHLCEVTADDYQVFRQAVDGYLSMFRERPQERERPASVRTSPRRSASKKARDAR